MMLAKMVTLCFLKIQVFLNKGYDIIIFVYDVTNKILSCNSIYVVNVICDQSLVIQFYKDLSRKTTFFAGWSWFRFNNLGLALGIALKFYTSVAKGLKLKVRKFWGLIPMIVGVIGEKLVGSLFGPPS